MRRLIAWVAFILTFCLCTTAIAAPGLELTPSTTSGEVTGAVVDGHWVYLENNNLFSLSLREKNTKPVLLEEDTIAFHVWDNRVMIYARPEANKPYRSILLTADGKNRTVIEKRQGEFYSPIGASGDVCYAYVGKLKRFSLSKNRVTSLGFSMRGSPQGIAGETIITADWGRDTIYGYSLKGNRKTLFAAKDQLMMVIFIGECVFVSTESKGSFLVWPDGAVRKLSEGKLWAQSPWAFTPKHVFIESSTTQKDAAGTAWTRCVISPEGLYPVDIDTMTISADGNGKAYLNEVDPAKMIPMSNYPLIK